MLSCDIKLLQIVGSKNKKKLWLTKFNDFDQDFHEALD